LNSTADVDDAGQYSVCTRHALCRCYQAKTTRALSSTATGTVSRAEPVHARRCTARHRTTSRIW
jgi:hypothetical protein